MLSHSPLDPFQKSLFYLYNKTTELLQHITPVINFYLTYSKIRMIASATNKMKGKILTREVNELQIKRS